MYVHSEERKRICISFEVIKSEDNTFRVQMYFKKLSNKKHIGKFAEDQLQCVSCVSLAVSKLMLHTSMSIYTALFTSAHTNLWFTVYTFVPVVLRVLFLSSKLFQWLCNEPPDMSFIDPSVYVMTFSGKNIFFVSEIWGDGYCIVYLAMEA